RAVDRAGNPLADGIAFSFTTMRELSIGIAPVHALTRALNPSELLFTLDEPIVVGDDEEDLAIRSTLTFDLASLPDEAQSVISATLATRRVTKGEAGTPFADLGGTVVVDHVLFAHLDDESGINGAFNSSSDALSTVPDFADVDDESIALDVTAEVADDLANRDARDDLSQFLLRFETFTDLDKKADRAHFSRDALALDVTYLVP